MRKLLMLCFITFFLAGCDTLKRDEIVVRHVVVAPADNLLLGCEIQAPPSKAVYLQGYAVESNTVSILQDTNWHLNRYLNAMKASERREKLLMETLTKNYQHLDVCNQRWSKLREWKAEAMKLDTVKKE